MTAVSPPMLQQGDVLDGKYVLRDPLGEGGMGSVFLADQPALERTVAIKVLHPRLAGCRAHAEQMREEAVAASRVRSPHCVAVIDCSTLPDGTPYLVMEYVPGRSLEQLIAEEPLSLARTIDLFDQVLRGLGAAHDAGIVHADVKSDNFLVESSGGRDHVTLIDFGLARLAGSPTCVELEDGAAIVSGTPEYMAPEVVGGAAPTRASDLYGAGAILYELLTGATPFAGGAAVEIMIRHASDDAIPPSLRRPDRCISPALDRVVLRALEKRPRARFPDAATFARALRAAAATTRAWPTTPVHSPVGSTAEAPTRSYTTPFPRRRVARGSDRGADHEAPGMREVTHGGDHTIPAFDRAQHRAHA